MWGAIKKALNSTLGTHKFQPLDELSKKNAYRTFYDRMRAMQQAFRNYEGEPLYYYVNIIEETEKQVVDENRSYGSLSFAVIVPPNTKAITSASTAPYVWFYPEGFERFEAGPISRGQIPSTKRFNRLYEFPSTTQFICEDAFSLLEENDRVIIHRRQGEIEGHPWGARYDIIRYLDR